MTRIRTLILSVALVALAGCQPEMPKAPDELAMEGPIASMPGAAATMDIGTVETTLLIQGAIAPETPRDTVTEEILEGMRGSTSLAMYTVKEPVPRPFLIRFCARARETYSRPVVLRGHIYRDDVPVKAVATLIGDTVPAGVYPAEFTVDAIEGLEALPESTLLVLKADVFLLPEGADLATVDLEHYTGPDAGFVMSNPVRVVFAAADAAV